MTARNSIIPVFVPHLGCPNDCVFCNQRRISGEKEAATAETVKNAIEKAAALTPSGTKRQLAFYGGSFTAIPKSSQTELLQAAAPYLEDGTIDSIRLSTRPDAIDGEVLKRLKHYGVRTIELGAQTTGCWHSPAGDTAQRTWRTLHDSSWRTVLSLSCK